MRKNYAYVTKMAYLRQAKICMAIFALAERLQTSATHAADYSWQIEQHES